MTAPDDPRDGVGREDPDATAIRPAVADEELFEDEEFQPEARGRRSLLTTLLIAALICAVGFFVGVQVGRLGAASTPAGGVGQRRSGAESSPSPGAAGSPSRSTGSGGGDAAPAVTGTVSAVRGLDLTVAGADGDPTAVTLTNKTVVSMAYGQRKIVVGDAVSVVGSTAVDGSINATAVTVRRANG